MPLSVLHVENRNYEIWIKEAYIMKLSDDKSFINKKIIVKTHTYIKELLPVTEPLYII